MRAKFPFLHNILDTLANFSPAEIEKQNHDLIDHANDFLTNEDSGLPVFLEPEAVQLLSFWCELKNKCVASLALS
ncbi:hypothetical protein [Lactiplantibacillus plantarum]|uniref:hypothetical protein n=1 Tax=Lactiplantibacillus plantarum TaxID=1590 RepID=UPI0038B31873